MQNIAFRRHPSGPPPQSVGYTWTTVNYIAFATLKRPKRQNIMRFGRLHAIWVWRGANNESSEVVDILLPGTFYFNPLTRLDNGTNFWQFDICGRGIEEVFFQTDEVGRGAGGEAPERVQKKSVFGRTSLMNSSSRGLIRPILAYIHKPIAILKITDVCHVS